MTPRTRPGNRDANFEVYYAKKVPHQVRFPYRRKTVRRPSLSTREDASKRQMVFLPDKMRDRPSKPVRGSAEGVEESDAGMGRPSESTPEEKQSVSILAKAATKRSEKRGSDPAVQNEDCEEEPVMPSYKRRRTTAIVKTERTVRRQSTMTQLVDGRRPQSGVDEPEFKPLKRSSRVSWAGKGQSKSRDKQQRTLTQMIPGIYPLEMISNEDFEEVISDIQVQERDIEAYDSAVARRLAVQGEDQVTDAEVAMKEATDNGQQCVIHFKHPKGRSPSGVLNPISNTTDGERGGNHRPTQYINDPSPRRNLPRRKSINIGRTVEPFGTVNSIMLKEAQKPGFSLLKTPEKRRVREIPSSQSPADSTLFCQISTQKSYQSPLVERSFKSMESPGTLSKRRQVASKAPSAPPALKKFENTIQDSEDEDDAIEDDQSILSSPLIRTEADYELGGLHTHTTKSLKTFHEEQAHRDTAEPSQGNNDGRKRAPTTEPQHQCEYHDSEESVITSVEMPLSNATEGPRSTPPPNDICHQETFPSTPMVIRDSSSDGDANDDFSPFRRHSPTNPQPGFTNQQQAANVDGHSLQVLRFPSAQHETQQSHSTSSSMHVAHNMYSYRPTQVNIAAPTQVTVCPVSQATTLDEVTQRTSIKNRSNTGQFASANTTPHRVASSQLVISPSKPPPLFIPSSFLSPAKTAMQEWSSPLCGRTQDVCSYSQFGPSLEEFSIPLPPPMDDKD